jgi:MYXO-CTERM domain-containing protein
VALWIGQITSKGDTMRKYLQLAVVAGVSGVLCGSAFGVDLTGGAQSYDITAGSNNVAVISFTYDTAGGSTLVDFNGLNGGSPSWMMPISFTSTGFSIDSDYGPYTLAKDLTDGSHNYVFTLNRANGAMNLSIDGSPITFMTVGGNTNNPQPDGTALDDVNGSPVTTGYFSDESETSGVNAVALGWAAWVDAGDHSQGLTGNAPDGVGGTGNYRIIFDQATGASVNSFNVVPEPSSALLGLFGVASLGLIRRRKSA